MVPLMVDVGDMGFLKKLDEGLAIRIETNVRMMWDGRVIMRFNNINHSLRINFYHEFFDVEILARVRPSLRPHNSTASEWVKPMALLKLPAQAPLGSLSKPPAKAIPGLPRADPSVLSLKKLGGEDSTLCWLCYSWQKRLLLEECGICLGWKLLFS